MDFKKLGKEYSNKFGWWILLTSFFILYSLSISPVVSSLAYLLERDCLPHDLDKTSEVDVKVALWLADA